MILSGVVKAHNSDRFPLRSMLCSSTHKIHNSFFFFYFDTIHEHVQKDVLMRLCPCVMWTIYATEVWDNNAQQKKMKRRKKGIE